MGYRIASALGLSILGAFLINRWLFQRARGNPGIVIFIAGPFVEESLKLLAAVGFGVYIPFVHLAFGIAEASYDILSSSKRGAACGILSIVGHTLFGIISQVLLTATGHAASALMAPWAFHVLWNWLIMIYLKLGRLRSC